MRSVQSDKQGTWLAAAAALYSMTYSVFDNAGGCGRGPTLAWALVMAVLGSPTKRPLLSLHPFLATCQAIPPSAQLLHVC